MSVGEDTHGRMFCDALVEDGSWGWTLDSVACYVEL